MCAIVKLSECVHVCSNALARHKRDSASQRQEHEISQEDEGSLIWHGSEAEATEVMVYHTAILRNKRLLMTYM